MPHEPKPIAEIERPSVEQFQRDIYFKAQSIVMRGVASNLEPVTVGLESPEALTAWFKQNVGQREVKIMAGKNALRYFRQSKRPIYICLR